MKVTKISWEFAKKYNIRNFDLSLDNLFKIIKDNEWEIFSYKENISLIESLGIKDNLEDADAFLYNFKFLKDDNIFNKIIIFYRDELTYEEKVFCILHEIGHIIINHTQSKNLIKKLVSYQEVEDFSEEDFDIEKEADIFAFEVLAPSCILKALNIVTFNDIKTFTMIPTKYINQYLTVIHESTLRISLKEGFSIYKMYFNYIFRFVLKKYKINIILTMILIFVTSLFLFSNHIQANRTFENITYDYVKKNNLEVYVTSKGNKYHKKDCFHLKNRETLKKIDLSEINSYEPCKICFKEFLK